MNNILIAIVVFGAVICSARHDDDDWHEHHHHMHHGHHGHHGHHRHHMPPFLKNVSKEARKEYYEILKKHDITIAKQKEEILEWAKKNKIEEQVNEFEENLKKHREEVKKNVDELLAAVPAVHKKFSEIVENENQTPAQMREAIETLKKEKSKEFDVMLFAAKEFRRHHRRHVGHHHGKHDNYHKKI